MILKISCKKKFLLSIIFNLVFFVFKAQAATTSLPLPRFVCLRSDEVNLRVGPGAEYPVEWVFRYQKMPVEIVQEFGPWRKIRNYEGAEGWVHQSMVSGRRMALVTSPKILLRKNPDENSKALALLEPYTVGRLLECGQQWCRLQMESHKGWILRTHLWGIYEPETKF